MYILKELGEFGRTQNIGANKSHGKQSLLTVTLAGH